jgi:hypothetical protein
VLDSQPAGDVVFDVTSSDSGEATVSPTTLTFTTGDWNTPQTVTITGVDDLTATNDSATVTVSVNDASSADPYDVLADQSVAVTCTNDDIPGINVEAISGDTAEAGTTATFTVGLGTQPIANVTIGLSSSDPSEGTVSPTSLTFGAGDWNTPQTVTVTGVDDGGPPIALKEVKAALPLQHDMVACMGIMYVSGVTGRGVASGLRWLEAAADAMQEAADEGAASHRQTAPPSL